MATSKPVPVSPMMYPVTVEFFERLPPSFRFGGCMVDDELVVDHALGAIVLQLVTPDAIFGTNPVVWTGEVPACMTVSRDSDTQVTIINWNTNMEVDDEYRYDFQVIVSYDGASYMSHDPTIINATIPTPLPGCDDGDDKKKEHGQRRVKREAAALRAV